MIAAIVRRAKTGFLLVCLAVLILALLDAWQGATGQGPEWLRLLLGPQRTLADRRIGLISGHRGNDVGAVCPDGLTEAAVNLSVAESVARALEQRGASVILLDEFDPRLPGYRADALLSIHSDSCDVDLSGFKVAGPAWDDPGSAALVECLWIYYASSTGLRPNVDTITDDMRAYHAFRKVAVETPVAIIEIGFLSQDRALLTRSPHKIAAGIVAGLECLLVKKK